MRKKLLDLYYGNITLPECIIRKDTELEEAVNLADRNYEKLRAMQGKKGKKRLEKYLEAETDAMELEHQEYFVAGMRLGFRLTLEMMSEEDEMLVPLGQYDHSRT